MYGRHLVGKGGGRSQVAICQGLEIAGSLLAEKAKLLRAAFIIRSTLVGGSERTSAYGRGLEVSRDLSLDW
jgi:hypothetical protein